ncbi:MAG: hypothetical protein ACU0A6_05970 [Shimia sp.]|uniref:hypothetical protein n=1 Tax=Shimia sp. TaxID=1954381 RepID=UPI004058C981
MQAPEAHAQSNDSAKFFNGDARPTGHILDARQMRDGEAVVWLNHAWFQQSPFSSPPKYLSFGGVWGVNDRLQLRLAAASSYGLQAATGGLLDTDDVGTLSASAQYQLHDWGDWNLGVMGSIEYINWQQAIPVGGRLLTASPAGSIHLPVTYAPSDNFAFNAALSYSLFPHFSNSGARVGQVLSIGSGVTFDPAGPLRLFASVNVPVAGENKLTASGQLIKETIWAVGGSADIRNGWSVDLTASNGF